MGEGSYKVTAEAIIEIVGKENIISATHCATRLRLIVKDKDLINKEELEKVPMVKGTFFNAGQYQIILGTGIVNKVYAEIETMNLATVSKEEQDAMAKEQQTGIKRLMRTLGDIFVPIIPVIAATGLFLGLKGCIFNDNVLALFGASSSMIPGYIITLVNVLTETAFAFLPAIICWSAYKGFGGMPVIGIVLGLMLVSPILPNAYSVADPNSGIGAVMAFGKIPVVGCQGSVLTAIMTALIGAKLEKKLRKIMPNALDLIMTPFIVMLVTFLVVILGIGPVMHLVELKLVEIVELLIHLPFGIGGFLVGATYPLLVITGLHHTYTMIETSLLANTGFNPVITLCAMYGFANVGTCLAFFMKSKKESVRQTAIGAMLSQLFGISEPVLFGLHLRYNLKPLIIMLCSSGAGAALLSILSIQSNSYGLAVIPSYLMYIYDWRQLAWYFAISIFSAVLCFILTCMFGLPKEVLGTDDEPKAAAPVPESSPMAAEETIVSPVEGQLIPIEEVHDAVFSGKVLGDGAAVIPYQGAVYAPADGTVVSVFDTKHMIGLQTAQGTEIIIHVGLDTVKLNGKYFTVHVKEHDHVKQGDLLLEFNKTGIEEEGYDPVVLVIVTNLAGEKQLDKTAPQDVNLSHTIFSVVTDRRQR